MIIPQDFCDGHARFTDGEAVYSFRVQDEVIVLKHDPEVFPPSSFGLRFAEQVDFRNCQRAADIGTGTGLLAILAAKKGVRHVAATDLSERAVQLTKLNARQMNGVDNIETRSGCFFCDLAGVFDVITANLPQEIIPPDYRAGLSRLQSEAIDGGGVYGNAILLRFLDIVSAYMHAGTRLYIIVNSITDYRETARQIEEKFKTTLIWEGMTSTKSFVGENIEYFRCLIDEGVVSLKEDASGNWSARQFIYELALKQNAESPA